jgi:predicted porin
MKGKIMDKKILLGGAAALLLVGNMIATPANAAIEIGIEGEATVSLTMGDVCDNTNAADNDVEQVLGTSDITGVNGLNTAITLSEDAAVTAADGVLGQPVADVSSTASINVSYDSNGCGTASEDNPVLDTGADFDISASGTLANGLTIDYSNTAALDDYSITFGGAFGSLTVESGISAVDEATVGDTAGADVTGPDMEGHVLSTDGSAGNAVLYTAPSMGNLDFMLSYAPNSADSGLDNAEYTDTFGIAAVFNADLMTISAGFESASSDETCGPVDYEFAGATLAYTPVNAENTDTGLDMIETSTAQALTADGLFDIVYGRDLCGDQDLVAVGMEMSAGDIGISAAYSAIDTDEADQTTMSVGLETAFGDYSLAAGYANTVLEYQAGSLEDEQTVIDVTLGTSLGDGVDLDLTFSNNDMSKASQANGAGDTTNYRAGMEITVGF